MAGAVRKRFDRPDETREVPDGVMKGVELAGSRVAKAMFQSGWRWSESVKPIVGGDMCQMHHVGYALSGRLHVVTMDGDEVEISGGMRTRCCPDTTRGWSAISPSRDSSFDPRTVDGYAKPESS